MSETITILNGTKLRCFPKKGIQEVQPIDNSMQIDMTGKYFQIGKQRHKKRMKQVPMEEKPEVKLFLQNAHFLFEHSDDILKDSRMFLCPIPIENELSISGTSGFRFPTLGIYVEWWGTCQDVRLLDENGGKWLAYHLSGSLLTHCNMCGLVNPEGNTYRLQIGKNFMEVCRRFMRINRRYDKAKLIYEAFPLSEVVRKLTQL